MEVNRIKPKVLALFIAMDIDIDMNEFGEEGNNRLCINEFIKRFAFSKERNLANQMSKRDFYIARECIDQLNKLNNSYMEGKKIKKRRGKKQGNKDVSFSDLNLSDRVRDKEIKKDNKQELLINKEEIDTESVKIGEAISQLQKLIEFMRSKPVRGRIEATEFFEKLGRSSFNLYKLLKNTPQKNETNQSEVLFSNIHNKLSSEKDQLLISLKEKLIRDGEHKGTERDSLLLSSIFNTKSIEEREINKLKFNSKKPFLVPGFTIPYFSNAIRPTVVKDSFFNPNSNCNMILERIKKIEKKPSDLNISTDIDRFRQSFPPIDSFNLTKSDIHSRNTDSFRVLQRENDHKSLISDNLAQTDSNKTD